MTDKMWDSFDEISHSDFLSNEGKSLDDVLLHLGEFDHHLIVVVLATNGLIQLLLTSFALLLLLLQIPLDLAKNPGRIVLSLVVKLLLDLLLLLLELLHTAWKVLDVLSFDALECSAMNGQLRI